MSTAKRQKVEHVSRSRGDAVFNHRDLVYNFVLDCLLPFELLTVKAINRGCRDVVQKYWDTDCKLPAYLRRAFEYFTGIPEAQLVHIREEHGFVTGPLLFSMMCIPTSQKMSPMMKHVYQYDLVFQNSKLRWTFNRGHQTMDWDPWREMLGKTRFLQFFLRCDGILDIAAIENRIMPGTKQLLTERRPTLVKYVAAWARYEHDTTRDIIAAGLSLPHLTVADVTTTPLVFIAKQTPAGFFRCAFDGVRLLVHNPNDFITRECTYRPRTYISIASSSFPVVSEIADTRIEFERLGFQVNTKYVPTHIFETN